MSISSVLSSSQSVSPSTMSGLSAGSASATSSGAASSGVSSSGQTLTESDFLTLLVTQLQNQDPTQPTSTNQLAEEIAGFTTANGMTQADNILQQISGGISQLDSAVTSTASGQAVATSSAATATSGL